MSQIEQVHARQVLDSRGNPTVEVEVSLKSGSAGAGCWSSMAVIVRGTDARCPRVVPLWRVVPGSS